MQKSSEFQDTSSKSLYFYSVRALLCSAPSLTSSWNPEFDPFDIETVQTTMMSVEKVLQAKIDIIL